MGTVRSFHLQPFDHPIPKALDARGLAYLAGAVALSSALTVFLVLCERDHSFLVKTNLVPTQTVHTQAAPARAVPSAPLALSGTALQNVARPDVTRVNVPYTAPTGQPVVDAGPVAKAASSGATLDTGGVARSHNELLALEKHTSRRYVEFTISKSRHVQPVGPIDIGVLRTDQRRQTYDLRVVADGHRVERKHVPVYAPVYIQSNERSHPLEFVVNKVDWDGVSGYLSEPRYNP